MKGFRFLLFGLVICLASGVKAQFYDSADDIYFYVTLDVDSEFMKWSYEDNPRTGFKKENNSQYRSCYIFNFDGMKACVWSPWVFNVKAYLKESPNYYEEKTEDTEYDLKYTSNNTYEQSTNSVINTYKFSSNRDELIYTEKTWSMPLGEFSHRWITSVYRCKRVDKSFFKVGRSRTPNSTLHE